MPFVRTARARARRAIPVGALLAVAFVATNSSASESKAARTPILPPAPAWAGKSRELVAPPGDAWITPSEASGFARTPRYDETVAWLRKLCDAAPELELQSFGKSPEGRDLWLVVAAHAPALTPEALRRTGRPIVFAQAGIHAGEIDGKDAGLMLLRDLVAGRRLEKLLDRASFVFVPIFNVDGHERFDAYTRINQRGPAEAGWRTTARNLNLNRDYMKLDAPETRAMVQALVRWDPDLYVDLHVTDGGDYQYDVTWGYDGASTWSPAITSWLEAKLTPALRDGLTAAGHIPGPFVAYLDEDRPERGLVDAIGMPRFSNGYGDARHLPTVLVENHSLKPYEQRVLGMYVLLRGMLETVGKESEALRRAIRADRERRAPELVLGWKEPTAAGKGTVEFRGVTSRLVPSAISGGLRTEWLGKPQTVTLPLTETTEIVAKATRPHAYWIPPAWSDVADRLALHGIRVERQTAPHEIDVRMYRIAKATLDSVPFEGHVRVVPRVETIAMRRTFPAGSVRVPTDQPLGDLAMLLLEPESPDSYFQWGGFDECLQQTEYVEAYIMEPMAERMLAEDDSLRAAFERKLRDEPGFARSSLARLQWFYRQTPFFDARARLYPVGKE